MKTVASAALALCISASLTNIASAQGTVSDPAVMEVIGDVGSVSARKALFKKIKKKPNSAACKAGEWEKLGFRHAFRYESGGKTYDDRLAMVRKKCEKAKVEVDEARYAAGYNEGRIMHCGYERGMMFGFYYGRRQPSSLCKGFGSKTYDQGLADGAVIYQINRDRNTLRNEYDAIQAEYTAFTSLVNGQPSTPAEQAELDDIIDARRFLEDELTLHEKVYREMRVTYHVRDTYSERLPDAELSYEIPPPPLPLN